MLKTAKDRSFSLLTHQILWYQVSGEGYQEIMEQVILRVYELPKFQLRGSREDISAFCISFIPKIPRLIRQFRYTGRSFECYLAKSVNLQIKSFLRQQYRQSHQSKAVVHHYKLQHELDQYVSDSIPAVRSAGTLQRPPCTNQRLLILVLVKALTLPPSLYGEIARSTGLPEDRVSELMLEVRLREDQRLQRFSYLKRMRDEYYSRLLSMQYQLRETVCDLQRQKLEERQQKLSRKLLRSRERIREFPVNVPHRVVASILDIPKGTVDSSIYYLKRQFVDQEEKMR